MVILLINCFIKKVLREIWDRPDPQDLPVHPVNYLYCLLNYCSSVTALLVARNATRKRRKIYQTTAIPELLGTCFAIS